ncbi:sigma-24, ECF subfamily [Candidatus Koribacter versatilis Ellin345]|uniref:Sigma-24, ECF subfamily n=1 Tax=Koribacter versatilis (strain Ellin345) TaxID=204669 RepID=Q1IPU9_KORVE|nr:RNA polymerase sigma factor [Candidatus Koribacter versatilis]ABF41101.1 sigma-24, ECF subfamily [Candidatus Koribacter versatilis Ellin345]
MEAPTANPPLVQFAQGDREAFEWLFREHQRAVRGWILRIVRDSAAADDLTIETFWRVYKAHAHFDPKRSFEAWVRRIATNVAIAHLKRQPKTLVELSDAPVPTHADSAVERDQRERIRSALASLPVKLRVPLMLALIEERPQREIAEALGISEAAVKSRVFRATQLLRQKLTRMGVTP